MLKSNGLRLQALVFFSGNPFVTHAISKFMNNSSLVLVAICCLVMIACDREQPESAPELRNQASPRSIEVIADEYLAAVLQRYPEMGTSYSIPGARHDRLFDNSLSALAEWRAKEDAWLQELERIEEPSEIGSRDWITYGILHEKLAASIGQRICRNELWQASSATSWHTSKPSVFEIQPVDSPDLKQQALDRLGQLAFFIDTEITNLRQGLLLGYSAPRVTVMPAVEEIRALLAPDSPLLSPGVRAGDAEFKAKVQLVFDKKVAPAVKRFVEFIEGEYLPQAREEIGLAYNPGGAECYPALVRFHATIAPSAEEIHRLGLEQIAGIRKEMQSVIDLHFPGETIETLMRNLNQDPRYTFSSRKEVQDYSESALDTARERMPEAFGLLPKAEVIIKPYPPYRESGTGEYHSSSEDGSRPGIYYIAVSHPQRRSRAIQQSVLYHETYPGHHLQGAIALELGDRVHPIARYLYNAGYGEGWALYSERLADEMGLYSGPLDRMGMLSDQAARAARLVIDSGIHTRGWSRQQSVDYMLANTAWQENDIESEINRYIAWPGQANAYMLGMEEIRRLRNLAERELEPRFDLRDFHDRVLENGSLTLPMLEGSILAWLGEKG